MDHCGEILVVDGDEEFALLMKTTLCDAGYACRTLTSGEEAIAVIDAAQPFLVFVDVHLPRISGFEVCRRVRQRYGYAAGVIFVSDNRLDPLDCVAGLELGADDYLRKPLDPRELVARVHALGRRMQPKRAGSVEKQRSFHHTALTRREFEVLDLIAAGRRQKEIAQILLISVKTVSTHLGHIFEKLDAHTQGEAVAVARELRILDDATFRPPLGRAGTMSHGRPDGRVAAVLLGFAATPELLGSVENVL